MGAGTAYIEPGSPWENGYVESFNGKFRNEPLSCEIFNTLAEAKVPIEQWRVRYDTARRHFCLGYRPPAPAALVPILPQQTTNPASIDSAQHYSLMLH